MDGDSKRVREIKEVWWEKELKSLRKKGRKEKWYLYFSYPYLSGACHDYYTVSYEILILDTDW